MAAFKRFVQNQQLGKRDGCEYVRGLHSGKISASQSWGPRFDPWAGRGLTIWEIFFPTKAQER